MLQTYQTKIKTGNTHYLDEAASFFGFLERKLFVRLYIQHMNTNECKKMFLSTYHITARQYNGIRIMLDGQVKSLVAKLNYDINQLKDKIKAIEYDLNQKTLRRETINKRIMEMKDQHHTNLKWKKIIKQYRNLKFKIHQKKRKLYRLKGKLNQLINDQKHNKLRLCFGSNQLLKKQFHLEENNYQNLKEWKEDWVDARNKTIYCIGSKDETGGNQTCTYSVKQKEIRLRVANLLVDQYGKYLIFSHIHFPYGQTFIEQALETYSGTTKGNRQTKYCKSAISYQFIRKDKGWYLHASVHIDTPEIVTRKALGGIGIDLNANFISLCEVDRSGNPIYQKRIRMNCYDRRTTQIEATLGDVVKEIVDYSLLTNKPIIIEQLDFNKKKTTLKQESKRYARMLSGFTYHKFSECLKSKAKKQGVEVIEVNPAYTSIIGQFKFMKRYGLSVHASAACVIARRGLGFKIEKPVYQNSFVQLTNNQSRYKSWVKLSYVIKSMYKYKERIQLLLT